MIKHMIIWKLEEGLTNEQKEEAKSNIKSRLEGLVGKIEGLLKMEIIIDKLESSSGDIMMDSEFVNEEALKAYQTHPLHVEIANNVVLNVAVRLSMDYEA